jgi:hypothetical protein
LTAHDARPKLLQQVTPLFDNQNNSEEVIPVERRLKISNIEANSVDSGIGGMPRSEINSLNEQTGNIKITEQQNTKFDANRLSLALSMYFLNFPTVQSLRLYLELAMLNFPEYFLFFVEIWYVLMLTEDSIYSNLHYFLFLFHRCQKHCQHSFEHFSVSSL